MSRIHNVSTRLWILLGRRNEADDLFTQLEQASTKLLHALQHASSAAAESLPKAEANGSLLCIRKHRLGGSSASGPISQDDVLRMLVRSSRCSRALALHLCPGASAFHVFSRRGWSRFSPLDGALVVTVGDQLQVINASCHKTQKLQLQLGKLKTSCMAKAKASNKKKCPYSKVQTMNCLNLEAMGTFHHLHHCSS